VDDILPWFILKSVPGIGNLLFKRLIDRFNSPERIFEATREDLQEVDGITPRLITSIKQHKISDSVKKDLDLVVQKGYKIVTMTDTGYPPLLRQIPDPPPFLYVFGHLKDSVRNIAVVGSRNATRYGVSTTHRLCSDLVKFDMTIASGMAAGIDSAAHEGALMGNGETIAVLGSGLERIYPEQNRNLFYQIAENGAVVPVEITCSIPGTTSMAIFVEKNPTPMVAQFDFMAGAESYISTRIKMGQTSLVRVAVKAGDKTYSASKEVKVTIGGCGG